LHKQAFVSDVLRDCIAPTIAVEGLQSPLRKVRIIPYQKSPGSIASLW
jgi:hypothetical protein